MCDETQLAMISDLPDEGDARRTLKTLVVETTMEGLQYRDRKRTMYDSPMVKLSRDANQRSANWQMLADAVVNISQDERTRISIKRDKKLVAMRDQRKTDEGLKKLKELYLQRVEEEWAKMAAKRAKPAPDAAPPAPAAEPVAPPASQAVS